MLFIRNKKGVLRGMAALLALFLLVTLLPGGNVQPASRTGHYQKRYKAKVSYPVWGQPAYGVVINRIRNGKVRFQISKAGVNGMAINLGYMLAPWNITVNSVAPGPLKGKMFSSMPQAQQDGLAAGIPLGRIGELSDIAAAVAYLGSDDAAWTTGEVLDVNGGLQY